MSRLHGLSSFMAPLALLLLAPACASSGAVMAAQRGDFPALKQLLVDEMREGKLDGGEARDVAHAVASYEIKETKGAEAVARIDELRACAAKVQGALDDRTKEEDEGGARAAYLLLDEHLTSRGRWAKRVESEAGYWRAVGARTLVDRDDGDRRRELFLDLNSDVRRAAMKASIESEDQRDAPLLLEAIRLDPDPQVKSLATQAAGELGGRDVVLALKDRWPSGDERLAAAIVSAWGAPASYGAGGREQLFRAAEAEHGAPAIVAASVLLRAGGEDANVGRAALLRAMTEGGAPNKVMAINLARLDDEPQKKAVVAASESTDGPVKVAALGRLTEDPALRPAALEALALIAVGDGHGRNAARSALAKARDRRVVSLLAEDTAAAEPGVRAWAAQELASMKEFPQAAQVLADTDASVRTRAACAILAMPK
jgi:HEAT repeat protein